MTRVVVVGNGMVGSRFASDLVARCGTVAGPSAVEVTVLGAEEYEPYNRVLLSEVVAGKVDVAAIGLPGADDTRVTVRRGTEARTRCARSTTRARSSRRRSTPGTRWSSVRASSGSRSRAGSRAAASR